MELTEACTKYIVFLRSLYLINQNNHWTVKGTNSYASHLLFERLYQAAQENADAAAEKCVGLFGTECLNLKSQGLLIAQHLAKYSEKEPISASLEAVENFLAFSKEFYQFLKDQDKMTQGMDNLLLAIADKQEEAVYLLKQSGEQMSNKVSALANKFKVKLAQQATSTLPAPQLGKSNDLKLQEAGENIKRTLLQDLGLADVPTTDLTFTVLRFAQDNSFIEYDLQVSATAAPKVQAATQAHKLLLGNYVVSLFKRFYPDLPARGTVRFG